MPPTTVTPPKQRPNGTSNRPSNLTVAMALIAPLVQAYNDLPYQERLERLYQWADVSASLHGNDRPMWATTVYQTLAQDSSNRQALQVHEHSQACLQLVYQLVDTWQAYDSNSSPGDPQDDSVFEQAIVLVFKRRRLFRILSVCLVLERARITVLDRKGSNHHPAKQLDRLLQSKLLGLCEQDPVLHRWWFQPLIRTDGKTDSDTMCQEKKRNTKE